MTIERVGNKGFIATFGTKQFTKGVHKWSYKIDKHSNSNKDLYINWGICTT